MSLNQLKKNTSSRKDDLEQLMYTLSFLAKGDLPWSLKKTYSSAEIIKAKSSPQIMDIMFSELPEQFRIAFNYIQSIEFTEEPDYDYLTCLFDSILDSKYTRKFSNTRPCQIVTPEDITAITEQEKKLFLAKNNNSYLFTEHSTRASIDIQPT